MNISPIDIQHSESQEIRWAEASGINSNEESLRCSFVPDCIMFETLFSLDVTVDLMDDQPIFLTSNLFNKQEIIGMFHPYSKIYDTKIILNPARQPVSRAIFRLFDGTDYTITDNTTNTILVKITYIKLKNKD